MAVKHVDLKHLLRDRPEHCLFFKGGQRPISVNGKEITAEPIAYAKLGEIACETAILELGPALKAKNKDSSYIEVWESPGNYTVLAAVSIDSEGRPEFSISGRYVLQVFRETRMLIDTASVSITVEGDAISSFKIATLDAGSLKGIVYAPFHDRDGHVIQSGNEVKLVIAKLDGVDDNGAHYIVKEHKGEK